MRIGIDARLWNETGVGRYTRNLIRQLQVIDSRNDYILFALSKDRQDIKFQISNFKFQIVNADVRWHSVAEQKAFPAILDKANLDLMHFPYFSVPLFYNRAFVVTIHDLILHHFATGEASTLPLPVYKIKHKAYQYLIKSSAKRSKKILTVSEATKKEIIDHLDVPGSKIVVTYEGIEDAATGKEVKVKGLPEKYFLHVGNVYPHKNTERLIEAFAIFLKNPPEIDPSPRAQDDIKLVFVGREDYFMKKLKERVSELRLESSVIFKGEVTDEALDGLYQNAIALVTPSLMEGFGLPAVEAIANRCIVVISNIPSHREIIGNAGIYFDPNAISDIAEKLISTYSMSKDERQKKIHIGLDEIKKYSWKNMAEKTLATYESSLSIRSDQ